MGVVFDTNALLSSTLWDESVAQRLLFKLIRENIKVYSSTEILLEYQRVLKRDFDYSDEEVSNIMKKIFGFVTLVTPKQRVKIVEDDPDDNKIIECAIESSSRYIITYDKHLLKLGEYQGIKMIKPEDALKVF